MNEQFITLEWLKKICPCEDKLEKFKKYFHNRVSVLGLLKCCVRINEDISFFAWLIDEIPSFPKNKEAEILNIVNKLAKRKYYGLAKTIIRKMSFNQTPLILDYLDSQLFYNGNVKVKGNVNSKMIFISGKLEVDGKIFIKNEGEVNAIYQDIFQEISATEINLINFSNIYGKVKTKTMNLENGSMATGYINANTVHINNSDIIGDVIANEIFEDNGLITGHAYTNKFKQTRKGKIIGEIKLLNNLPVTNI